MSFRGGEFSAGTTGNFQSELTYSAWKVMALWDLYLESESWWARRTGWSAYGMIRDAGRLMDDQRFKQLAGTHEESLATRRFGQFSTARDILDCVGFR
jgi:hypothetical protein